MLKNINPEEMNSNLNEILNSGLKPFSSLHNLTAEINDAVKQELLSSEVISRRLVAGACITCSKSEEATSETRLYSPQKIKIAVAEMPSLSFMTKSCGGIVTQGLLELCHKDIEFSPLFKKCKACEDKICKPIIENGEWKGYDESYKVGDGFGLNKEEAYMICTNGEGGYLYVTDDGQKNCMREFRIWKNETPKDEEQDFESQLRNKGFPEGYIKYLMLLHNKYPKWEFEPVFTNVDYQEFLKYQVEKNNKCADSSAYAAYCTDTRFVGEDDPKYYVATEEAIRYFSHPYSMLLTDIGNYENTLQFLSAEQNLPKEFSDKLVSSILRNRDEKVVELIKNADTCVNPVFLASIYGCENGPVGESYNGKIVYNPFNIGATSGRKSSLEYAYKHQWYTPEKCIEGSEELFQRYIDRGQNTLYALDWDYQSFGSNSSVKQYATLVNDGEDKAIKMRKSGGDLFDLDYELIFSIPIYDNIPTYNDEEFAAFPDPNKK